MVRSPAVLCGGKPTPNAVPTTITALGAWIWPAWTAAAAVPSWMSVMSMR